MDKSSRLFRLGEKIMIECQVEGSRPRAKISWFKDKLQLEQQQFRQLDEAASHKADSGYTMAADDQLNHGHLISEINTSTQTSNFTQISYLTMVPQLSDNMKTISCVASNPSISSGGGFAEPLSDSIVMNVQCKCVK